MSALSPIAEAAPSLEEGIMSRNAVPVAQVAKSLRLTPAKQRALAQLERTAGWRPQTRLKRSASARDNQGAALDTENVSRAPTCTTPRRGNEGRAPLTPTDGNGTVRRRASASTPIERRHLFRDRYGSALEGCGPASVREGHPVYGQLLHDSGFKRVYATSAKRLVENVPVWHRQRPVNAARVKEILNAKSTRPHFPGVILIFEMEGVAAPSLSVPQRRAIFDGQHRVLAASTMLLHGAPDFVLHTEVYPTKSDDDVKRLFLEVNKAERVEEIDLPDALAPRAKKVIDDAVAVLEGKYADMFKPSPRCRVPHVNREVLRTKLFEAAIVDRRALRDSAQLVAILEDANTRLAAQPRDKWAPSLRGHRKLDKAAAHGFYLGMGWQWLDEL